jgi:hypothetical protein
MTSALQKPITSLPCDSGTSANTADVLIEIKQMTWHHVNIWHTLVQPLIDSLFEHWHAGVSAQNARADVGWDWARNYGLTLLHNTACYIPGNQSGLARALALTVNTTDGDEIPVGMLTVVPEFNCNIENVVATRTFAWYLADAPRAFYSTVLGVDPVKGVALALLDCAIQSGFDAGSNGATLLHADPNGGHKLTEFYENRCGMRKLNLGNGSLSLLRRNHAEQYYAMDAAAAVRFCQNFNVRR